LSCRDAGRLSPSQTAAAITQIEPLWDRAGAAQSMVFGTSSGQIGILPITE
jgi:hypothetical protein